MKNVHVVRKIITYLIFGQENRMYNTEDNLVETNFTSKQYDNCVIHEKWISTGINKGASYNFMTDPITPGIKFG